MIADIQETIPRTYNLMRGDFVHLFHLKKDEQNAVRDLEQLFIGSYQNYRINGWHFKIKTDQDLLPYVDTINRITGKALHTDNTKVVTMGNSFLNQLQCDFVIANHEQKLAPVFDQSHKKIDQFMKNVPDTTENEELKRVIAKSNYLRMHFFDHY